MNNSILQSPCKGRISQEIELVFLGEYVDQGRFPTADMIDLYALKLVFPKSFFLLRGNH
jgi:serine/threonine-protein phosphatase 2B catalytic subunit